MSSKPLVNVRFVVAAILLSGLSPAANAQLVGLLPDSAIRRFYEEHESDYAAERRAMLPTARHVTRIGGTLSLRLRDGKLLSFVDTLAEGDNHHRYMYEGYHAAEHLHVLQQWFYEGSLYILVHDLTGQEEVVPGAPRFASDGKTLFSASLDLEAGYDPNRIEVWSISPRGLKRQFVQEWSASSGPDSVAWAGRDSIRFVRVSMNQGSGAVRRAPQWLIRKGSTWKVSSRVQ